MTVQSTASENRDVADEVRTIGKIPVRNVWLLILYASEYYKEIEADEKVRHEENPDDIPNLVAEILTRRVEHRIKRNLTYGYRPKSLIVSRVRGRINHISTERKLLLHRGKIACSFDEMTVNTERNRFVRAALQMISKLVKDRQLAHRCRKLANSLLCMGVTGQCPSRNEMSIDRIGSHDADDRLMVYAAQLAFDLALPTEDAGVKFLRKPEREKSFIYKIYEKGIAGFYDATLSHRGWKVQPGVQLSWKHESLSPKIDDFLPSMKTDIVLEHKETGRRIIIDTKFNSILTSGWYREETLRSGYIYQIYAYLRSQEGRGDPLADSASGILLHPSVGTEVDESVKIQNHKIRFATVDLRQTPKEIRIRLLYLIDDYATA